MVLKASRCPNCGSNLQIPDDQVSVPCGSCGFNITVGEVIHVHHTNLPGVTNLLRLARVALESQNYPDAHTRYSSVIELDPNNVEAWLGRAVSAAWQSSYEDDRLQECLTCYKQANEIGIGDDKALEKASMDLVDLVAAFSENMWKCASETERANSVDLVGRNALETFSNSLHNKNVKRELAAYLGSRINNCLALLDLAWDLRPDTRICVRSINICHRYLESDVLTDLTKQRMNETIARNNARAREIDPNFEPPKKSGCFVATAAMGSPFDPQVMVLREFRDQCLCRTRSGRAFIRFYYFLGPSLADFIRPWRILRILTYLLLVRPAARISKWFLIIR